MRTLRHCLLIATLVVLLLCNSVVEAKKKGSKKLRKKKGEKSGAGTPPSTIVDAIPCGSRNLPPCPSGLMCIDPDLTDSCTPLADCPGICALDPATPRCAGLTGIACPAGQMCVDGPDPTCLIAADCLGICVDIPFCGGIAGFACPEGLTCVDDPNDSCDPTAGGADCGGMCLPQAPTDCPSATSWPEVVGLTGEAAKAAIDAKEPCLSVEVIPDGYAVTADYRVDRVRIFVNAKDIVEIVPIIG
jgi:Potato inhibitor I family